MCAWSAADQASNTSTDRSDSPSTMTATVLLEPFLNVSLKWCTRRPQTCSDTRPATTLRSLIGRTYTAFCCLAMAVRYQTSPSKLLWSQGVKCTLSFLHRVIDYVYFAKCLYVCDLPDLLRIFPIAWANIRVAFWPAHNWKLVTWSHHNRLTPQTCNVHTTKFCNMLPFFSLLDKPSTPLPAKNPASHSCHTQATVWTPNLHIDVPILAQNTVRTAFATSMLICYQPSTRHQQMFGP